MSETNDRKLETLAAIYEGVELIQQSLNQQQRIIDALKETIDKWVADNQGQIYYFDEKHDNGEGTVGGQVNE